MKALVLAFGAAFVATTIPASASVVTVGGTLARSCYLAAKLGQASAATIAQCDRAFLEQPLSRADELATHVNRGILRMTNSDLVGARADFERATAINPNHPEPWLNLGIMAFNMGDTAAALPLFDRAIRLGTNAPELAYFGRALANEDRGNVRAAYADFTRAASLKPDWDEPARELARYRVRER